MNNLNIYKILIVDDEEVTRDYVRKYFEKRHNIEIFCAADGQAAIELTKSMCPDLLVLDIQMPKLSGWDVIKEVRKFNLLVKIIVVTGQMVVEEENQGLVSKHVVALFHKPLRLKELFEKVQEIAGSNFQILEPCNTEASVARRPEAGEIAHSLANIHNKIRIGCDGLVCDYEDGLLKTKSDAELFQESLKILKNVMSLVDEAGAVVDEVRKL
ncbi:MAG: response regulator [Candidatus Omnitrophica bacterium]|nr:response regulator [Candidatus Omnitrophota bacterium]